MLMILVQQILRMILNHLSQCHLGVRLCLRISDVLVPTETINEAKLYCSAFILCFIDHVFPVSDSRQLQCWYFLKFFPLFSTAAFESEMFIAWSIRINFYTIL